MMSALIVSSSEKLSAFFCECLETIGCNSIHRTQTSSQAMRIFEGAQDLPGICVINSPLPDDRELELARLSVSRGICQTLICLPSRADSALIGELTGLGICAVTKPINREIFASYLRLCAAISKRLSLMEAKNTSLTMKIEDHRIVDRAKLILVSYLNMSEAEAHKYIEKQAMNGRITKREIAEGILKTYEN